jgi:hypothetical protein
MHCGEGVAAVCYFLIEREEKKDTANDHAKTEYSVYHISPKIRQVL